MMQWFGADDPFACPGRWYGPAIFVPAVWPCAACGEDVRRTDWCCVRCQWGATEGERGCDHVIACGPCAETGSGRVVAGAYQPGLFGEWAA